MKTRHKVLLISSLISASAIAYAAQEYWVADIRIESVRATTQGNRFKCNTIIRSSHDDDARNAKAIIMFSPEIRYVSSRVTNLNLQKYPRTKNDGRSTSCRASRAAGASSNGQNSYVECSLGNLSTQARLQVEISGVVTKRTKFRPNCSTLVMSATPDFRHQNNYMVGR